MREPLQVTARRAAALGNRQKQLPGKPLREGTALTRAEGETAAQGNGLSSRTREPRPPMRKGTVFKRAPGNRGAKEPNSRVERGTAQSDLLPPRAHPQVVVRAKVLAWEVSCGKETGKRSQTSYYLVRFPSAADLLPGTT